VWVDLQIDQPANLPLQDVDLRIGPTSDLIRVVQIDPTMPKNPLNVARAYTDMQRIKDLDLNMYQRQILSIAGREVFNKLLLLFVFLSQCLLFFIVYFHTFFEVKDGS